MLTFEFLFDCHIKHISSYLIVNVTFQFPLYSYITFQFHFDGEVNISVPF